MRYSPLLPFFLVITLTLIVSGWIPATIAEQQNINTLSTSGEILYPVAPAHNQPHLSLIGLSKDEMKALTLDEANQFSFISSQASAASTVLSYKSSGSTTKHLIYRNTRTCNDNNAEEFALFMANDWLAKDADGDLITARLWGNDYLIEFDLPEVREYLANWILSYIQDYGYDGCFLDWGANPTIDSRFWGCVKAGVEPETLTVPLRDNGNAWTDQFLIDSYVSFTNLLKQKNPDIVVIGNGMHAGERWNRNKDKYEYLWQNGGYDGFHCEFMWWKSDEFYSVSDWELSVELGTWAANNKIILIHDARQYRSSRIKAGGRPESPEDNLMFAYCSMLMSFSEYTHFVGYHAGKPDAEILQPLLYGLIEQDLGNPRDNYYVQQNGLYTREFDNCFVYVNPASVTTGGMEPYTGRIEWK